MNKSNFNMNTPDLGSLDLKTYLLKVTSYWKLFLLTIVIALAIAKYNNMMNTDIYNVNKCTCILYTSVYNYIFN